MPFSFASGGGFLVPIFYLLCFIQYCPASPFVNSGFEKRHQLLTPYKFFNLSGSNQPENIVQRADGHLLVTVDTEPDLYQINPAFPQLGGPLLRFPSNYTSLFGIVQLKGDIFYVTACNYTGAPDYYGIKGTTSVFEIDLRRGINSYSWLVNIPEVGLLDGLALVNETAGLLVSGDGQSGKLYVIDVNSRTAKVVAESPLLEGIATAQNASLQHLGINGVKVYKGDMYFTNTAKGTFGKLPLDTTTGNPTGPPSILANYSTYTNDLTFGSNGDAFIMEPLIGVILRPFNTTPSNNQTRLLSRLPGGNSNLLSRTWGYKCTLYATFNGNPGGGVAFIDLGEKAKCKGRNE